LHGTAYSRKKTIALDMTFVLPEIEKASCQLFTTCGRVVTKDKSLRKLFPKKPFIASVKCGRLMRFVRLAIHEGGVLHLDVATPAYFEGRWNPKPTHAWPQIQTALSRFSGQAIEVRGVGVFLLPFARLPESSPIRALSAESKTPKMSMKLTSGAFSVTGAPIEKIMWSLVE
jgi:hypothetical protein